MLAGLAFATASVTATGQRNGDVTSTAVPTPGSLVAQATSRDLEAIASWVAVDVATGYERRWRQHSPRRWASGRVDAWGNVVATVGSGSPHRIVACALDRPSYAVSQIRDDGYLRLHRIGAGSRHVLWDQQFEAQQVRVLTAAGPVAGVVAVVQRTLRAPARWRNRAGDRRRSLGRCRCRVARRRRSARHRVAGSRSAATCRHGRSRAAWRGQTPGDGPGAPRSLLSPRLRARAACRVAQPLC